MSSARADAVEPADGATQPRATEPAARVLGLRPYTPEAAADHIDLRLDANEGLPPTDEVLSTLRTITPEQLRRYPDTSALEARIAQHSGVHADRVIVTNGGDDAIDRVCRAVLEPGKMLLTHEPGFVMIPRGARLAGGGVRTVAWYEGPFPTDRLTALIGEDTKLLALVTPNNPTGGVIDTDSLVRIARAASAIGAVVLVDLAYVEFADEDPTPRLVGERNVVIVRTLSKAAGLAGARVGFAIAPPDIADWMRTVGAPFPVSSASLALAAAALERRTSRDEYIESVRRQRESLITLLAQVGGRPIASQANFVMAAFDDAGSVHRGLADEGILVRSLSTGGGETDALRITLPGTDAEFDRLCASLRSVCGQAGKEAL
ncbi:MAG: histidinol-phosphate transaminase [Planctomycetota bacterium]